MNKKETINNIQRRLQSEKGFPDVSFLDKLSEENVFHLFMDLVLSSDFVKNKIEKKLKEETGICNKCSLESRFIVNREFEVIKYGK